jgi:hypothetical protein
LSQITESKAEVVRQLIERAPDGAIRSLLLALQADGGHDDGLSRVQQMIEVEASDRTARNLTFAPVAPLCADPALLRGLAFPPRTLALIWRALKEEAPSEAAAAKSLANNWRGADSSPDLFNSICARAALALRYGEGAFAAAAEAADQGDGRGKLAACLDIGPIVRRALEQMPEWLGRMTTEKAAKLRLAYRDAVAVSDDAGPLFFEMLAAHLAEPWLILRVISGVMDRPTEAYMSSSELAGFGERVMADIDRQLAMVSAFKPVAGRKAAHAAALAVHAVSQEVAEVEQSIRLSPDGVWGRRLAKQKQSMAAVIEAHLKAADGAVAQALPLQTLRIGARTIRGVPRLTHDPDRALVDKAAALLIFMDEVRPSAAAGGFASARGKAIEELENRIDTYVEHVLEEIRADDGVDPDRARAFLEIAAELSAIGRDEKSAQIIRRRAAAAA